MLPEPLISAARLERSDIVQTENSSHALNIDPRETLNKAPMGWLQILIIALTLGLNAMDGIDVLSIGLAAKPISDQWNLSETLLGVTMIMELIGMGIGSLLLGWVADTIGRRKTMFWCMAMMAIGMFMATTSGNLYYLWFWRILTGLGIGGLLSSITALTAEFSNLKNRALCIFIMGIGYPIGGIFGSMYAGYLLETYGNWHLIFYFGAALTVFFIPLFYFIVPESVHWLVRKQPDGALDKVNRIMKRLGHKAVAALPEVKAEVGSKSSVGDLFTPSLRWITTIIAVAYFLQIFTYYFILKWVPKVVVNMEFSQAQGNEMLMYANIGGVTGGIILGLLTLRFSVKKLTIAVLTLSGVCFIILGYTPEVLTHIAFRVAFCGFFGNAGIIGLYALFPAAFPTRMRASGTGFVLSVGRLGAGLSPPFVGFLFDQGIGLSSVLLIISIGTFLGAGVLAFLKLKKSVE
jgi:benzoate transport